MDPIYVARFRLRSDFDLSTLPNQAARTIAQALKTYGMFLDDGGNVPLTIDQSAAGIVVGSHDLAALHVTDFEIVTMAIRPVDADVRLHSDAGHPDSSRPGGPGLRPTSPSAIRLRRREAHLRGARYGDLRRDGFPWDIRTHGGAFFEGHAEADVVLDPVASVEEMREEQASPRPEGEEVIVLFRGDPVAGCAPWARGPPGNHGARRGNRRRMTAR